MPFYNDNVLIPKVMKDHLNSWNRKPVDILFEDFGRNVPSMMLQQLAATEKKKVYVDGSYVGVWKFAIYMRVMADDTASRYDAIACLTELASWLTERDDHGKYVNLPEIDDVRQATSVELSTTPSIAARYPEGYEDYQAIFSLEYKSRRK